MWKVWRGATLGTDRPARLSAGRVPCGRQDLALAGTCHGAFSCRMASRCGGAAGRGLETCGVVAWLCLVAASLPLLRCGFFVAHVPQLPATQPAPNAQPRVHQTP